MTTDTFAYTGTAQQWTVPAGVTTVSVDMAGAQGAPTGIGSNRGGKGARLQCDLAVTPGEILDVIVGGHGGVGVASAGGFGGGGAGGTGSGLPVGPGGGGASSILRAGTPLAVAAGGGGAGGQGSTVNGGKGGAPNGDQGNSDGVSTAGRGGNGGTAVAGGSGGAAGFGGGGGVAGSAGTAISPGGLTSGGAGGAGADVNSAGGGGGGGGRYGGGGGGGGDTFGSASGGGGGGGSTVGSGVAETQTDGYIPLLSGGPFDGYISLTYTAVFNAAVHFTASGDLNLGCPTIRVVIPARAGLLGTGEYQCQIVERVTHTPLGTLRAVSGTWERVLDGVSEATVTVNVGGDSDRACCDLLGAIRALQHELEIYRNGRLAWAGPLLEPDIGRDEATLTARDLLWWPMEGRLLHYDHDYPAGTDLADVFNAYMVDALRPDPVGLVVVATATGVTGERSVLASDYRQAGDELRELLTTGVDVTVIGRTAMVGGRQIGAPAVARLFDQHFQGEVRVVEEGFSANTRVVTVGAPGIVGIAGGTNSRVGLVEKVVAEPSIKDARSAQVNAQTRVDLNGEPAVHIVVPAGSALSPTAPVTIDELVPGALVDVAISALCRQVVETQRLARVTVSFDGAGETVGVDLQPLGST